MIPNVVTEVDFTNDPTSATRTWTDISAYVKRADPTHGRADEYADFEPGQNALVLRDDGRQFDSTYSSSPYYPNVVPMRPVRQYVPGPLIGTEFWGDFETGAAGTAPEWTAMNGFVETLAGSEARQLTYVTTPTPRLGARAARFEVASGDKFGVTTGERAEVRRGTPNGGFATGTPDGVEAYYQFSFRPLAPWTHPTNWEIFHQQHSFDARFGQAQLRLQTTADRANFMLSLDTGEYPTLTDANNGTNAGTNYDITGPAWAADVWWDVRYAIRWTSGNDGWFIWEMKQSTSSTWVRYGSLGGIQTLPTVKGNATVGTIGDKIGFYRNDQAITNVVFHDGYQVGHSWTDVAYDGYTTDSRWNDKGWEGREQATTQGGNPDFEADIVGTASAGGGTTTRTWDTTRSKFGSGALKLVTNGAASGQGAFHTKRSGSRYDITAGEEITVATWYSGDGFEMVRLAIEWFNGAGTSISTTFGDSRSLRTDFRRWYLTATAPANTATFRIRTSLTSTNAATWWVDGVDWWKGGMDHSLFEGYVEKWETTTDRLFQIETTAECVDARAVLNMVAQPTSDPSVEGYDEVVAYSQPSFYYRKGEPEGTKLVSHVRRTKKKLSLGGGTNPAFHHITKKWNTRETRAEVEGVSGPAGTYGKNPTLGVPGAIIGDSDTAVLYNRSLAQYARISLDAETAETVAGNRLTVEAWVKLTSNSTDTNVILTGPGDGAGGNVWNFFTGAGSDLAAFAVNDNAGGTRQVEGTTTLTAGTWYHVVGTWNQNEIAIWVNAVKEKSAGTGGTSIKTPVASSKLYIAGDPAITNSFGGAIDEVAIYEKVLEPATILAHYNAGLRGYNQELTGTRIANTIAASGISLTQDLGAGVHYVLPRRQSGQPSIDPITEAVAAEGGMSGFFFSASGVAVFLPRDYRDNYPYTTNQATFGDLEPEIAYDDHGFDRGADRLFNQVRIEADGGTLQQADDTTSQGRYFVRTLEETGLPMVSNDDALTEANWLLSRSKDPRWRVTSVTFPADQGIDTAAQLQQALNRECGDAITFKRRVKGQAPYSQISSIERISHSIDFEANTWQTTYGLAPLADDLSTGWVLGVPGATELQSTAVLN